MNLLNEVKKILDKYDLSVSIPDQYDTVYQWINFELKGFNGIKEKDLSKDDHEAYHNFLRYELEQNLFKKYKNHIPRGWYGFAIGTPTPTSWFMALDEILQLLISKDPNFSIFQIKTKYGGIKFYVSSAIINDIDKIEDEIEDRMYDEKLIY